MRFSDSDVEAFAMWCACDVSVGRFDALMKG